MQLLTTIHSAEQGAVTLFRKAVGNDITIRQLMVLAAVKAAPGGSQTAIVNATGIDRSTLADLVKRMQRKGLVTRRRTKEDARAYAVVITPAGEKELARASKVIPRVEAALVELMPSLKGLA